jgi:hypothetical protein
MSEKIKLDEAQMATLGSALVVAAQALYHYADVSDSMGSPATAALLRNQAEDMELLLGYVPFVERITVRLNDDAPYVATGTVTGTRIVF